MENITKSMITTWNNKASKAVATTSAAGLMSAADKKKLDNLAGGGSGGISGDYVVSVNGKTGVVTLSKSDVGLGNVDNTADAQKEVLSATKLQTARKIIIGSSEKNFDGSADVSWSLTEIGAANDVDVVKLAGIQTVSGVKTFSENTYHSKDLYVTGNIYQQGSAYETHAEKLYTKNDVVILRDGAVAGLAAGEYTGILAKLYDGANDGRLIFDKNGIARVGDAGSEQALATREENPVAGKVPIWNPETMRFETVNSPTTVDGFGITDAVTLDEMTTTGEDGKVVRTWRQGGLKLEQSTNNSMGLDITNLSDGPFATSEINIKSDLQNWITTRVCGSEYSLPNFGKNVANYVLLYATGMNNEGFITGTGSTKPYSIVTDGIERLIFDGSGIPSGYSVTSTAETDKLIKANSTGITVTKAYPSFIGFFATNTDTGASANACIRLTNNNSAVAYLGVAGSGVTSTMFGVTLANYARLSASLGAEGLLIGTTAAKPVIIGANQIAMMICSGDASKITVLKNSEFSGYIGQSRGANVEANGTITPSSSIFHLVGTAAVPISTISVPYTGFTGSITIIPDINISTNTGGNIARASSLVVGKAIVMTYDSTTAKWYPSY